MGLPELTFLIKKTGIASNIRPIEAGGGVALEPLGNPAGAEHIQMGYEAYGSDGQVIEGGRDFDGEINDKQSNIDTLSQQVTELEAQVATQYQSGYDQGYSEGYIDGSGGLVPGHRPLSYTWDEDTLTLTITEVSA